VNVRSCMMFVVFFSSPFPPTTISTSFLSVRKTSAIIVYQLSPHRPTRLRTHHTLTASYHRHTYYRAAAAAVSLARRVTAARFPASQRHAQHRTTAPLSSRTEALTASFPTPLLSLSSSPSYSPLYVFRGADNLLIATTHNNLLTSLDHVISLGRRRALASMAS
jgi:hypothetical protein